MPVYLLGYTQSTILVNSLTSKVAEGRKGLLNKQQDGDGHLYHAGIFYFILVYVSNVSVM